MTIPRIMRGTDPAVYRQDWITTSAITALAAGTASVNFTVSDASLFPRGTGSGEPGECVIITAGDAEAGREVLYDWASVSGNTLMGCSRRYGSTTQVGDTVKIAFTGGMYESIRSEFTTKTDKVTPSASGNIASLNAGGNLSDSGLTKSTDTTLAANSDLLLPTQKAVKTYVDVYWSSRMHYLASAAEIISAFADTSPGYHNYVVAPDSYTFTADIVKAPGRTIKYSPGVNFTMNNNSKITLGRIADAHFYGQWDTKCVIDAATGVITGSSAALGGAFDWSAIASQAGAKIFTRGITFDVDTATANTITPIQINPANNPPDYGTAYGCAVMVPATGIEVSGELNLIAGAGHSGLLLDLKGAEKCDFGNWIVRLRLPAVMTAVHPADIRWMANGVFPQLILSNQNVEMSTVTTLYLFNPAFCHNMVVKRFESSRMTFMYNDAANTYARILSAALGSYVTAGYGSIQSVDNYFYDLQGTTNLLIINIAGAFATQVSVDDKSSSCDGSRTDIDYTGSHGSGYGVFTRVY